MTAPPALLFISSWIPEDLVDEFAEWCDAHQRGLATVPGLRRARRFVLEEAPPADVPDMLTMYEVDSIELTGTVSWRERGFAHGPLPIAIAERLRSSRRDLSVVAALPARWWPPRPSQRLDLFTLADRRGVDRLVAAFDAVTSDAPLPVTVRLLDGEDGPPLVLIDHHDDEGDDLIDLLTDTSGANTSRWTVAFDIAGPGSGTGDAP